MASLKEALGRVMMGAGGGLTGKDYLGAYLENKKEEMELAKTKAGFTTLQEGIAAGREVSEIYEENMGNPYLRNAVKEYTSIMKDLTDDESKLSPEDVKEKLKSGELNFGETTEEPTEDKGRNLWGRIGDALSWWSTEYESGVRERSEKWLNNNNYTVNENNLNKVIESNPRTPQEFKILKDSLEPKKGEPEKGATYEFDDGINRKYLGDGKWEPPLK